MLSSPGAYGFTPWIDREHGYYAILGMELEPSDEGVVGFAVALQQKLKALVPAMLRAR